MEKTDKNIGPACDGCQTTEAVLYVAKSAYWEGEKVLCENCYEAYFQEFMRQREGGY